MNSEHTDRIKKAYEKLSTALMIKHSEGFVPKGAIWVHAILEDEGKVKVIDCGHNLICVGSGILLARLAANNTEPMAGFSFLAVGLGAPNIDLQNPPAPQPSDIILANELARKRFASVNFVDQNGLPTMNKTNIVDFLTTFTEGEAVGPIVELGIFGGDATEARNSGTLVNHITFPVVNKSAQATLSWVIRFVF